MSYIRKTVDEWELFIDYGQGLELLTTETSRKRVKIVGNAP